MASLPSNYTYAPLDSTTQEIRLITLHPNTSLTAPITITLSTTSLLTQPAYEAISYVWGDPTITTPITLDGIAVPVTTNLETALRHFRLSSEERILWADALCINQLDDLEKNVQVSMMGTIYRSCSKCLAWLGGDEHGDGEVTFAMIEEISSGKSSPFVECADTDPHPKSWLTSLRKMMQKSYWSRIWVVQETILPLHVEYWCGRNTVDRKTWIDACRPTGYQCMAQSAKLCNECSLGLIAFLSEAGSILSDSGASLAEAYSASNSIWALHHTSGLLCQDPLDKVYAVRSLTSPGFQAAIVVNYGNMSLNMLATHVLKADVVESGSLRMLGMVDRVDSEGEFSCPSWWPVPQWIPELVDMYEQRTRATKSTIVQNANFNASGSSKAVLDCVDIEKGLLGVSSVLWDTVDTVGWFKNTGSDIFMDTVKQMVTTIGLSKDEEHIWTSDHDQAGCPSSRELQNPSQYVGGGTTSNALWRTLISDHVLSDNYRCWDRAKESNEHGFWDLWTKTRRVRMSAYIASVSKTAELHFYIVFNYATSSRSFLTTRKGYIGTGPDATRSGDEIHLVAGSNWPLVLRKISDATASSPARYRCLGKCYIHGIMDGEAADNFEKRATGIYLA
ncbi:heterokaryon incompatibility protein-domain-containing protein [Rhexocercosporidium sp. MPI-PUGE-AT-0058]|nr:heterokaryon incompatibility protein-domain-containing protein [Rhexocercosporidium sp. MPI-PUGE-AT-0058]